MITIPKKILGEKKLYSPGPIPQKIELDISFSHRSPEFKQLYKDTKRKLRERFNIPDKYNILFTQGSGTSAIETVLSCLVGFPRWHSTGIFTERAIKIADSYMRPDYVGNRVYHYYTQFETARSSYFCPDYRLDEDIAQVDPDGTLVVDCVSGFGFYPLPDAANVIIASSSKILGGLPVMGIILYDTKAYARFDHRGDYLNILNYINHDKKNETPHTSLIPQLISLNKALNDIISPSQIEENCRALHSERFEYIGEKVAPVISIKVSDPIEWVGKFRKYNAEIYFNPNYMKDYFQVSMFNYRDPIYYQFIREVLENG